MPEPFAHTAYPRKHPYGERAPVGKKLGRDIGNETPTKGMQYYLDHPVELLRLRHDPFLSAEAKKQYALHVIQGDEVVAVYLVRQDGNVIEIINSDDIAEDKERGMGARNHRYYHFDERGRFIDSKNAEHKDLHKN